MTTVVVAGALANKHRLGGSQWVRMSWAESLKRLGFDVVFVEELHDGGDAATFHSALRTMGVRGALLDGDEVSGMTWPELHDRLDAAALLVNISGHLRRAELLRRVRLRAFVDLDPGYTQVWHAEGHDVGVLGHDHHFTVGCNIGTRDCPLPTAGIRWRPIRQPVVMERWRPAGDGFSRFTTVASWRGAFGPIAWGGRTYGVKAHEFRRFAQLPSQTGLPFEVALDIHPADTPDRELLEQGGWRLVTPGAVSTPAGFARYVRGSGAEFSVAQGVYVHTRSGWFSDRTVRYLASGRPALVQDTGFRKSIPTGDGLIAFSTRRQAAGHAMRIVNDYEHHARAAAELAAELFAPDRALAPLLDVTGVAP
jgi:hypothetical protein